MSAAIEKPWRVLGGVALLAALFALGAVAACTEGNPATPGAGGDDAGVGDAGPPCPGPADVPQSCPSPAPSWEGGVQAIVDRRCGPCHLEGGVATLISAFDYSTYAGVHAHFGTMLSFLGSCRMPPADAGQPTLAERETLLAWLVCAAPNN